MIYKTIILLLTFFSFSYSSYQEVKIGKIDNYYKDKLSYEQLKSIIGEIESSLESQLNMNLFDYSQNGKEIDILYVLPSKLEQRISNKINRFALKQEKIKELKTLFLDKQNEITDLQNIYNKQTSLVNEKTDILNFYVRNTNKKKNISKDEYQKIQEYVKIEKEKIDIEVKKQKILYKELTKLTNSHNQKIFSYNNLINQSKILYNEIESMSRSFKKIKGKTFGEENITLKTYYKEGNKVQEKNIVNNMNKIEIYDFETIAELKVILAHEIAHLLGIPHINVQNALMNPVLQKNQENELLLTSEDIINFKENY